MAEAIGSGGFSLGDKGAVGIVDTLGHRDHAVTLFFINPLHITEEALHIKVRFGEINQVRAGAIGSGQRGGTGQPAGVAAHDLNDADHAGIVDPGILINLHAACCDVLGGRGEAGAVIRAEQVIVNGLGDAHDTALIADLLHILGDFVAGVHGIVAAVVEKVSDIVLFEYL